MKRINIGLIGVGGRGGLAMHMHRPDLNVYVSCGCDINNEPCEKFKEEVNSDFYYSNNYTDILNDKDVDAVVISTPDNFHEEMAVKALLNGKDVYLEKPMAITIEGCEKILDTWKKSGKKLMIGFNMRHMPMYKTMKEIINRGDIGEVKSIWCRHFVGEGGNFYYHDWHANSKNTTSLLLQKGSHDIDIIHWLANSYTKKLSAFGGLDYFGGNMENTLKCPDCNSKDSCVEYNTNGGRNLCAYRKEVDVEDNNMIIMELENKVKASYLQCHFTPDYQRNYTVIGTEGRIENFELEDKIIVKSRKSNTFKEFSDVTYNLNKIEGSHGGGDIRIAKDFLDMLLYDKPPLSDPLSGRMSVAVGVLATQSIRDGGKVLNMI